jgi:hypothetical protein
MAFKLDKIKVALDTVVADYEGQNAAAGWFPGAVYESGVSVAQVAEWNEEGTTRSPARPFLRPCVEKQKAKWTDAVAYLIKQGQTANNTLEAVGNMMSADIAQQIEETSSPELSPITLLLRLWRREGRTITGKTVGEAARAIAQGADYSGAPTEPLTDTGHMIATVTNAVVPKQ